ncbi:MAG TPA: hypothetical protein VL049_26960 [Candidatus Dormibacteraeota bacterium]|nr:hypothetical protein [Candidatus Dormibacteraeota bacterium]
MHCAVAQREDLALIALAARPIGLDLQRVDAVINDLLPDALAPAERAALAALPAVRTAGAAALLLASKFAYCRARRAALELSSLVIALAGGGESPHLCVGVAGDDPDEWTLRSLTTAPGHVAVLAVPGGAGWRLQWQPLRGLPAPT